MRKIKIQAEGKNSQAAYTINNYNLSLMHVQNLCDWTMLGAGIILLLSIIGLSFAMHDYWATMLCFIIFGFGMFLFFLAFFPYIYLEYGYKKSE